VVGVDAEWEPTLSGQGCRSSHPVSTLQVASMIPFVTNLHIVGIHLRFSMMQLGVRNMCFIFDMLVMAKSNLLKSVDKLLCRLFSSPLVLKLGHEVQGDLARLAASYPVLTAPARVASCLELRTLASVQKATQGVGGAGLSKYV
jgi:hypothetical protein